MRTISEIYDIMREVRERIIATMEERGINEIVLCEDRDKWIDANPDKYEEDYDEYAEEMSAYVTYFDKYGCGYEYNVTKVTLHKKARGHDERFTFDAFSDELGHENFGEWDITPLSKISVYEALEKALGIGK